MKSSNNGTPEHQKPTTSAFRHRLLRRIDAAKLPGDAKNFTLTEITEAGLTKEYENNREKGWPDNLFKALVLLAVQNNRLREQYHRLVQQIKEQKPYYSPIRDEGLNEPDPVKLAEINHRAEADEARVAKARADKKKSEDDSWKRILEAFGRRTWTDRDKSRRVYRPFFWHEPMTINDYQDATGISRRTLLNILKRLQAKPVTSRNNLNEPVTYGPNTNYAVLSVWLTKYVKKPEHRRAWLVRTLLKTAHEAPDFLKALAPALKPVFVSLGISDIANATEFWDYFSQCDSELYPRLAEGSYFSDPLTSALFSVGKSG
jgi:hypothetical protein